MKSPVSLEYVIVVALLAVSAAVLSYVMVNPVFNLSALLLGSDLGPCLAVLLTILPRISLTKKVG